MGGELPSFLSNIPRFMATLLFRQPSSYYNTFYAISPMTCSPEVALTLHHHHLHHNFVSHLFHFVSHLAREPLPGGSRLLRLAPVSLAPRLTSTTRPPEAVLTLWHAPLSLVPRLTCETFPGGRLDEAREPGTRGPHTQPDQGPEQPHQAPGAGGLRGAHMRSREQDEGAVGPGPRAVPTRQPELASWEEGKLAH